MFYNGLFKAACPRKTKRAELGLAITGYPSRRSKSELSDLAETEGWNAA